MISRVSSHLLFCEPDKILRQMIVERDENMTVTAIFSLLDSMVESAQTFFYDGVISSRIVSLKQKLIKEQFTEIREKYNYVDFSEKGSIVDFTDEKPLIIDFGTENTEEVNLILQKISALPDLSLFEFIAACVYYPALILGRIAVPELNRKAELILWEHTDMINMQIKPDTRIRNI